MPQLSGCPNGKATWEGQTEERSAEVFAGITRCSGTSCFSAQVTELSQTEDPGGTSFSVGAGGLPSLSSPMAASANLVGVLVFRAGDDRCCGLSIGLSNVVYGVVNCLVPLHCTKRATILVKMTGYICREAPKSGAYSSPNVFLGELPESIITFVNSQACPPAAFHTLFAILSSSSFSELDSFTEKDLVSKMYQAPFWGASSLVKVLEGTARKAKKQSFDYRLSDVGEELAFKSAELELSPETVEVTFEAVVPDLRTSLLDDVNSLAFVIAEWPKVVESVFILRFQVRLAANFKVTRRFFSGLIVGLDNKLAFLKGCVGSPPPMPGATMFDHGLNLFTAANGVAGSISVIKDNVAKLLSNGSDIPGRVCWL